MPLAATTLQILADAGVHEFVICAGARNAALLVTLTAAPEPVRLWHHFEERAAAFFALGRVRAGGRPVAVVTTSGTAVAELLPAMVEAHYQGLPLVALTADRPSSYRGSGAPQAIEQPGIFGPYAPVAVDAESVEDLDGLDAWDGRSPLHVNLCLEEPAASALPGLRKAGAGLTFSEPPAPARAVVAGAPDLTRFPAPVVLLGDLLASEREAVSAFCQRLGAPVFAEAASGLRESAVLAPLMLRGGDAVLAATPHRSVLRLGGVPASRFWRDLEARPDIPVLSFSRSGHGGLARPCAVRRLDPDSLSAWSTALPPAPLQAVPASPAAARLDALLTEFSASEPALVRQLASRIPEGAAILTGNSLPIREWNLCAPVDVPRPAWALRGANGIDGNLSAFLGYAADAPEAWCLAGDLTTLYDLAAPWILAQLPGLRVRFAVIKNAGGRIFSRLPALRGLLPRERTFMENPHTRRLEGWAQMWGMEYLRVTGPLPALTDLPDRVVLTLVPDPVQTEQFWAAWNSAR